MDEIPGGTAALADILRRVASLEMRIDADAGRLRALSRQFAEDASSLAEDRAALARLCGDIGRLIHGAEHAADATAPGLWILAYNTNERIRAIKALRTITGWGLHETKALSESAFPFRVPAVDNATAAAGASTILREADAGFVFKYVDAACPTSP